MTVGVNLTDIAPRTHRGAEPVTASLAVGVFEGCIADDVGVVIVGEDRDKRYTAVLVVETHCIPLWAIPDGPAVFAHLLGDGPAEFIERLLGVDVDVDSVGIVQCGGIGVQAGGTFTRYCGVGADTLGEFIDARVDFFAGLVFGHGVPVGARSAAGH